MHPVIGYYVIRYKRNNLNQYITFLIQMILEFSGKQSAIRQITKLLYIYENLKNMPDIKINYPLQSLNTFGIPVYAKYYLEINSVDQLPEMVQNPIS